MADDYIDLVLCKNEDEEEMLAKAPAWSNLKEGDWVILEKEDIHKKAIVEKVITIKLMGDEISFILMATRNNPLKTKVRSKIKKENFSYPEDEPEDEGEENGEFNYSR